MTAVGVTLGLAAACWVFAVREMTGTDMTGTDMTGMDMGAATQLGSFASFIAVWVSMMAAMMLPGVVPAVSRCVHSGAGLRAVPLFVGAYLAVWAAVGIPVYALYRPHGSLVAGAITIAAGAYELSPVKRRCRRHCREGVHSGLKFGLYCLGSCLGLMLMMVALGIMSVTWMSVVAVLVIAQKLLPEQAAIDVPLALAVIGLGILTCVAPMAIPGIVPVM